MVDTRRSTPCLLVADRKNNRLQSFSLEGGHLGFAHGVNLPCHFHERQGTLLVPDLASRVTVMDLDNQVLAHLGEGEPVLSESFASNRARSSMGSLVLRTVPGSITRAISCRRGVEIGRVTKLRRLS
jgi:hypothetical protein